MRSAIPAAVLSLVVADLARADPSGLADAGTPELAVCTSAETCAMRHGYGSVCTDGQCAEYQDKTDSSTLLGITEKGVEHPQAFKPLFTLLPVVAYNPTQGALIGGAAIVGIYLGDPATTTISNISANVLYSTKNQLLSGINSVLMLADNSWQLQGDWRFLISTRTPSGLAPAPPRSRRGSPSTGMAPRRPSRRASRWT